MRLPKRQIALRFTFSILAVNLCAGIASAQQNPNPSLRMSDLFALKLSHGILSIESNYKPNQADVSEFVQIDGYTGSAEVFVKRDDKGKLLEFGLHLTTEARQGERMVILSRTSSAIEIFGDYYDGSPPKKHTVEVVQKPEGDDQVSVFRIDADHNEVAYPIADGRSFAEMVTKNSHIADQFIRPIVTNDLKTWGIFGPPSLQAKVVLAKECPVTADIAASVGALVDQLNADAYADRAAADQQLNDKGVDAILCLLKVDPSQLSPEQSARIQGILHRHHVPSADEVARFRQDPHFLMDCLMSQNLQVRKAALQVLNQLVGRDVPFDVGGNFSQRADAVEQLRPQIETPATRP